MIDAEQFLVSIEDAKLRGAYVDPAAGRVPFREWVAELVAEGLSAKRARKAHQVLSQILASAVDGGRLPRNVADDKSSPRSSARRCTS